MNVIGLTAEQVAVIHEGILRLEGGAPGIRDVGALESSINAPVQMFGGKYLHEDVYEMAGAYLFYLAKNHPFVDGNKRTAAIAATTFLDMNGITFSPPGFDYIAFVVSVASGEVKKGAVADYFRKWSE